MLVPATDRRGLGAAKENQLLPKWRGHSIFGPGLRVALDRNARARFRFLARMHRAPGRLSAGALAVAEVLVRLLGPDGRLDPSHVFLARLATVSEDTVQRALDRMRALGLLTWQRRLRRDSGTGWRCEQTSNAYVLTPAACDPQIAGAVRIDLKKKDGIEGRQVVAEVHQANLVALAAIAAKRMRTLGLA